MEKAASTIKFRIRTAFFLYGVVSLALSIYLWRGIHPYLNWELLYQFLFPLSSLSCMFMLIRPKIGEGSLFLLPLFTASLTLIVDLWVGYLNDERTLAGATASTGAWSFLAVSIAYIDLLESKIYHRMVAYIDQQSSQ